MWHQAITELKLSNIQDCYKLALLQFITRSMKGVLFSPVAFFTIFTQKHLSSWMSYLSHNWLNHLVHGENVLASLRLLLV